MSRLVIIDGHAIAHRAYYSIPPLTVNGSPVNVIYGFYSMLLTALDILKPRYLVICLDSPGPTFRSQEFIGYRAKRKVPDRDLIVQLPELPKSLKLGGIPNFAMGGFEADDLIATLTAQAKKHKKITKITIITGDKDLMQLVDNRVELFVPIRGLSETKIFGVDEVKEKLGVLPSQVVDLKALMGDMSDNYPGVAGIGPKAAISLLDKYHSLDNIYTHLTEIPKTLQAKLTSGREDAYLSQKLATLISNIPIKLSFKQARWHKAHALKLIPVFETYHFKSLISRLHKKYGLSFKPKPLKSSNQTSLF